MECTVSEGVVKVVFQHYYHGLATALLVNHSIGSTVEYYQKYVAVKIQCCVDAASVTVVEFTSLNLNFLLAPNVGWVL